MAQFLDNIIFIVIAGFIVVCVVGFVKLISGI